MNLRGLVARVQEWLTSGHRHEFEVVKKFTARSAISDAERIFDRGEKVICAEPGASTIMLETGGAFFLVDRPVFEACCKAVRPASTPA